jgi:signal transduction histidine kinase
MKIKLQLGGTPLPETPLDPKRFEKALREAFPELAAGAGPQALPGAPSAFLDGRDELRKTLPFATMLAHELKAPLNAVEGYLRMIDGREAGDAVSSYDRMVKRSLARLEGMRELVEDLIALAKAETGSQSLEIKDISVSEACREAVEPLLDQAGSRGVAVEIASGEETSFPSAPGELRAIFSNLISTAIKYNRSGGRAEVSFYEREGILSIRVSDNGIGIAPEELARLTGEFARIRNQDTRETPGSGLGLAIVRRLAARYGGELSIQSRRGEGSIFVATLKRR